MAGFYEHPMASYPSINDRKPDLWKKIAWNFYSLATANGVTGLNPPNWNDNELVSIKKSTYFSASVN